MVCRRRARSRDPRSSHSTSCCPVSIHIINKRLYTPQIVCSLCAVHSPDSSTWSCPATAHRAARRRRIELSLFIYLINGCLHSRLFAVFALYTARTPAHGAAQPQHFVLLCHGPLCTLGGA